MRVSVRLDPNRLRRWHLRLLKRLARRPRTQVAVEWTKTADELPSAIPLLFALERLIHGLPENDSVAVVGAEDFAAFPTSRGHAADVVLDFTAGKAQAAVIASGKSLSTAAVAKPRRLPPWWQVIHRRSRSSMLLQA
jgi:hypothetical protein